MARIAALIAMVGGLYFGGATLISHEVHSVQNSVSSMKTELSSITSNFNAGVTALHNADSGSPQGGPLG
jgi:hypothetical protein